MRWKSVVLPNRVKKLCPRSPTLRGPSTPRRPTTISRAYRRDASLHSVQSFRHEARAGQVSGDASSRATRVIQTICVAFDKMQALFDEALSTLIRIQNVLAVRWDLTSTVVDYQRTLVAEWDRALVLPANVRDGMVQTSPTSVALQKNNWIRSRNDNPLAGGCYPLESFTLNINPSFQHVTKGPCLEKKKEEGIQQPRFWGSTHFREAGSYDSDEDMEMD